MLLLHLLDGFSASTSIRFRLQRALLRFVRPIGLRLGLLFHFRNLLARLGVPSLQLEIKVVFSAPLLLLELLDPLRRMLLPLSSLV